MRKLIALGTMVVLMLAVTSPAFARAVADDGAIADDSDVRTLHVDYVDASQVQAAAAWQSNTGDATATAHDDGVADASIDQSLTIDQSQVNGGFDDDFFHDDVWVWWWW